MIDVCKLRTKIQKLRSILNLNIRFQIQTSQSWNILFHSLINLVAAEYQTHIAFLYCFFHRIIYVQRSKISFMVRVAMARSKAQAAALLLLL